RILYKRTRIMRLLISHNLLPRTERILLPLKKPLSRSFFFPFALSCLSRLKAEKPPGDQGNCRLLSSSGKGKKMQLLLWLKRFTEASRSRAHFLPRSGTWARAFGLLHNASQDPE